MVLKFQETGSVADAKPTRRTLKARTTENIAAVRESVAESPGTTTRHRSQQLHISRTSLRLVLTND